MNARPGKPSATTKPKSVAATERGFLEMVQNVDAIVWEAEFPSWRFLFVSDAAERILGYPVERWLEDENFRVDLLHPEDRDRAIAHCQSMAQLGLDHDLEFRMIAADGRPRWLRNHVRVATRADGPPRLLGVMVDITEQKHAEAMLLEERDFISAVLDTAGALVLVMDPQGRIERFNRACELTSGYSLAEVRDRPFWEILIPENELAEVKRVITEVVQGRFPNQHESHWKCRNGELRRMVWTNTTLAGPDGALKFIVATGIDVTERRRAEEALHEKEEQLRQAQKMDAVGRLAGGVAHDFNNLLTAILGYSELLIGSLQDDEPLRLQAEEIRKAAERAATLTRQLLAFSRKQVLEPRVLDLNVVLRDLEEMLRRLIGEDIQLGISVQDSLGRVRVDPGQLTQVILNLVLNARDAMPQGGRLHIATENIELTPDEAERRGLPAQCVTLSVRDGGAGMDEETLSRIFEPFFTTKGLGKGTGLGLATVYGIVRQSGGDLEVSSQPGRGTTVRIILPRVATPAPAEVQPVPVLRATGGGETILLVEDEPMVRLLMCETLRRCGYHVIEVADALEALGATEAGGAPIDMMVTDVVMPFMSGPELAVRVRARRPGLDVLFVSGYTDDAMTRHGAVVEGAAFLQKPFAPEILAVKVREILDGAARRG